MLKWFYKQIIYWYTLNVHITDWPWYISFTGLGDTSDTTEIIENTEFVNRTCVADCNPNCNYTWINSTDSNVVSYTELLDLHMPTRYEADNYTCIASNMYGIKTKLFSLNIKCKYLKYNYYYRYEKLIFRLF